MVELLISSNISRYTEFKSVTRVLTLIQDRLEQVRYETVSGSHSSDDSGAKLQERCVQHQADQRGGEEDSDEVPDSVCSGD